MSIRALNWHAPKTCARAVKEMVEISFVKSSLTAGLTEGNLNGPALGNLLSLFSRRLQHYRVNNLMSLYFTFRSKEREEPLVLLVLR